MDLKYHLFYGSGLAGSDMELRNQIFDYWMNFWIEVYDLANSDYVPKSDDFLRQHSLGCIMDGSKVVAILGNCFFNLKSKATLKHSYFKFYSEEFIKKLEWRNVEKVMTFEFLTVDPEYRKAKLGFSLGAIMVQCGIYVFRDSDADAVISSARNDNGAADYAYDLGFRCLVPKTRQRNFECDLIACFRGEERQSKREGIAPTAEKLWADKIVHMDDARRKKSFPRAA